MDCGQDPGPAAGRPCREGRSRSRTPSSSAEEQVAMETEAVFHSYVFHRYQQEQESSGGQSPRDPEMAAISHNPGSVMEQVGRQLAIIGDDINRRYEPEFQGMLLILRPTEENAFTYFTKIACSLFESGINWGRVVVLLGFGYRLAMHVYHQGLKGFLGRIARFVADFVLHNCIARWIARRGGWVAALSLSNSSLMQVFAVLCLVLIVQCVIRRFSAP
ncbi:bcl-2 homologous antagonist/killer isoform X4 [Ornithorhynchus anatinus]|uniref:bcl-2 homologous antagonist/killer isoform X4 n=1 Tax=Ornithorhynchus anatinus TaxID=9258 RepID=UPI0010A8F0B8|nr:bcl-2 homologous antagonist/killer isoform X4 [Ornithorhynchus anatinus]